MISELPDLCHTRHRTALRARPCDDPGVMHRPAHDQLAEKIEHDAQVELAFEVRISVMSVTHLVSGSLALKSRSSRFVTPIGRTPGLPPKRRLPLSRPALQAGAGHQARHAVETDALALVGEILVHTWRADHSRLSSWISRMRSSRRALARTAALAFDTPRHRSHSSRPQGSGTSSHGILAAAVCNHRVRSVTASRSTLPRLLKNRVPGRPSTARA